MNHELQPAALQRMDQPQFLLPAPPPDRFSKATLLRAQLHRCWTALRRRWWVLLLSFLLIGGPAVYYAVITPPTFQSQAIMWLTGKLNLPGEGLYAEELTSYIATQAELIKSPTIQSRAFEKVRARFPGIAGAKTNTASIHFPFDLSVRSSQKNSVLALGATGPSPEATRAFLNAVMDEYFALKRDSRKRTSSGALSSITDQIKEVEKQIQLQQDEITLFQTANNISYLTEHGLSAGSHLAKIVEMLSDLRTECRLLELLTPAEVMGIAEGPLAANSSAVVPGEKAARAVAFTTAASQSAYYQALQQIQILKAKRNEFAQALRPTHSKMLKLSQEISGLEQLLKTLKEEGDEQALAQMVNRRKSLELQIENLESQQRAWETNAAQASRKLAEFDRLKQDLQRSQALYDRLLGLLQTVDLNHNLDQEPLVPLEAASLARPTLTRYGMAAAGLFLALLLGVGAFFFMETLDDRFTSVRELSIHLDADVMGQIPETQLDKRNGKPRWLRRPKEQEAFTESFRDLRSSLFFRFAEAARPRIILVTSAVPKEGKSTVAANLASALALSGLHVLVIDADLRRGFLHQIFGAKAQPGLREVLNQAVPLADAIVPVQLEPAASGSASGPQGSGVRGPASGLRPPTSPSLFILPAGAAGTAASEVHLHSQMKGLLHELAAQYNYIVIDSPPVLATNDVMGLASVADGAFMVVRASYTSSRMVREAMDRLHRCNVKILGIVYNRAAPSTDYYHRYSRDYHSTQGATSLSVPESAEILAEKGESAG